MNHLKNIRALAKMFGNKTTFTMQDFKTFLEKMKQQGVPSGCLTARDFENSIVFKGLR